VLDQQLVAGVPAAGPVEVQRLLVAVPVTAGPHGLGLVEPPLRKQQPLGEEVLPPRRLLRRQQGAVEAQHLPHGTLPEPADPHREEKGITILLLLPILLSNSFCPKHGHITGNNRLQLVFVVDSFTLPMSPINYKQ